jgi:hypothetical protein
MAVSDPQADEQVRAAQQRAATRTALVLAVIAVAIYAWVFISKL